LKLDRIMSDTVNATSHSMSGSDIWRGARTYCRVVVGLIFRDAAARFGSSPLSYVWTIVEPAVLIAILLVARVYFKNISPAFGESSVLFLLTGLVSFRATRNVINVGARGISANSKLFEFGAVKPPDTVLARTILEFTIWVVILTIFFTAVREIMQQEIITDFQGFVLAMLMILYFCIAMAMFNATVGALVPAWRSVWKMMSVPLMVSSGVLYVPAQMPPEMVSFIIWNPFLHCVEGLRSHSYLDYISLYSPYYLLSFSTVVLIFSLALERLFRKEIIRAEGDDEEEDLLLL